MSRRKREDLSPRGLGALVRSRLGSLSPTDSIHDCGSSVTSRLSTHPKEVIDLAHQKLHAFPFREVPLCWRRAYEEGCVWKIVNLLNDCEFGASDNKQSPRDRTHGALQYNAWIEEVVHLCDMALILTAAPGRRELIDRVLTGLEKLDQNALDEYGYPIKRQRLGSCTDGSSALTFSSVRRAAIPKLSQPINRVSCPSLDWFRNHMHKEGTPVVIIDTVAHWPALRRWRDPRYWLRKTYSGRRLVPVEVGRSYTDEGWGQKIIPFGKYLMEQLIESGVEASVEAETKGYLAQHDLLTQVPALREDILIPDYCYVDPPRPPTSIPLQVADTPGAYATPLSAAEAQDSEAEDEITEPMLNIWLGPEFTISPAHTDPHHNILAQVVGRKYVRLFAPSETAKMYPMAKDSIDMGNTSSVDVGAFVDLEAPAAVTDEKMMHRRQEQESRHPLFARAKYVEAILEPGDCLYIPRGWWHYVRSLEVSCSVSFWWD